MRRSRSALAAIAAAVLLAVAPAAPASAKGGGPDLNASAWLLVDANDGQRLASSAPSRPLAIASATKLMTAYLALKELPLDRKLTAPQYDALPAESILGLHAGERATVENLLYSLILASANDSAVTIAEGVSGSVPAFVDEMNATAQRLGLDDTSYTNPIGLDAPGNHSSARDLAALAERLMRDRLFRRIADSTEATIETDQRTISIPTRNTLLLSDPTLTGIKTGHTLDAGYVLVGSATRDDVDLISIVLGAPSESARDAETAELLDYGFSNYSRRTPVSAGEALAEPELADQGETLRLVADRPAPGRRPRRPGGRDRDRRSRRGGGPDRARGEARLGRRHGGRPQGRVRPARRRTLRRGRDVHREGAIALSLTVGADSDRPRRHTCRVAVGDSPRQAAADTRGAHEKS